jgi:hypothetical protein
MSDKRPTQNPQNPETHLPPTPAPLEQVHVLLALQVAGSEPPTFTIHRPATGRSRQIMSLQVGAGGRQAADAASGGGSVLGAQLGAGSRAGCRAFHVVCVKQEPRTLLKQLVENTQFVSF